MIHQLSRSNRGFTLIELLVVIAIISFLASIMFAGFSTSRAQARTVRRVQDMSEVQKALELYRSQNGQYPVSVRPGGQVGAVCWECGNDSVYDSNKLSSELAPYLSTLPKDPQLTTTRFTEYERGYWYQSDGKDYKFANIIYNDPTSSLALSLQDNVFVSPTGSRRAVSKRSSSRAANWSTVCLGDCDNPSPFGAWINYLGSGGSGSYNALSGQQGSFTGQATQQSFRIDSVVEDMISLTLSPAAEVWCATLNQGPKTSITLPISCGYISIVWP